MGQVAESASPASRLPQVSGAVQARDGAGCGVSIAGCRLPQVMGAVQALWELACQRWGRCRVSIAGKPAPTGNGCSAGLVEDGLPGMGQVAGSASPAAGSHRYWVQCRPCGSWLASDGAGCRFIIAGKPAPTGNGCSAGLVGAGLPAMGQVAGLSSPQAAPSGQNTISFSLLFLRSTALGT